VLVIITMMAVCLVLVHAACSESSAHNVTGMVDIYSRLIIKIGVVFKIEGAASKLGGKTVYGPELYKVKAMVTHA
jgi:hypothetical protein